MLLAEIKAEADDVFDADAERVLLERIFGFYYAAVLAAVHEVVRASFVDVPGFDPDTFILEDSATVRLLAQAGTQIVRITETTRQAIAQQLQVGAQRGYNTFQIAHGVPSDGYAGINGLFRETWAGRAEMVARTELQNAQRLAAIDRYNATGLVDEVELIDGDEWDSVCANRNGRVVPLAQAPGLAHPNCLVSGQIVWAPNRQAGSARWFDGEVVILRTAANDLLTATPNHPILTSIGWQPIGISRQGDRVIRCLQPERVSALVDPDHKHGPAMIDEVVDSFGPASHRTPATVPLSTEAFHGDTQSGDVCVVWTDGSTELRARNMTGKPPVRITDTVPKHFASRRSTLEAFHRVTLTSASDIGVSRIPGSFLGRSSRLAQLGGHARRTSPTPASDPTGDRRFMHADDLRDLTNAHLLEDVEVIEIRRLVRRGYVYNLQTTQGWYVASNLITHNCTLVLLPVLRAGV